MNKKLSKKTIDILKKLNINELTEIQKECLSSYPNKDILVQSPTGTGKTLGFLLPLFENLYKNPNKALIIVPTRELATQIYNISSLFIESGLLIGGTTDKFTDKSLILVCTPGRLYQILIEDKNKFSKVKFLVLDEADKLLSLGFKNKLINIIKLLPKTSNALFSATMNSIIDLSKILLRNPVRIVSDQNIPLSLKYVICNPFEKLKLIFSINNPTIIFFATCAEVDYFYSLVIFLKSINRNVNNNSLNINDKYCDENINNKVNDIPILKLHSKMTQNERNEIYKEIENRNKFILFCTDIAARGLDFEIPQVIHFDIPLEPLNFIHRSGRTGRNGKKGESIMFLMKNELAYLRYLEQKNYELEEIKLEFEEINCKEIDKNIEELAVKAFVSYIRAYKEYQLSFLFKYQELDFDSLVKLFFLRKIPVMDELRKIKFTGFKKEKRMNKNESKALSIKRSKQLKYKRLKKRNK